MKKSRYEPKISLWKNLAMQKSCYEEISLWKNLAMERSHYEMVLHVVYICAIFARPFLFANWCSLYPFVTYVATGAPQKNHVRFLCEICVKSCSWNDLAKQAGSSQSLFQDLSSGGSNKRSKTTLCRLCLDEPSAAAFDMLWTILVRRNPDWLPKPAHSSAPTAEEQIQRHEWQSLLQTAPWFHCTGQREHALEPHSNTNVISISARRLQSARQFTIEIAPKRDFYRLDAVGGITPPRPTAQHMLL